MNKSPEGDAGGAFGEPGFGVIIPRGARDIEVNPWSVACEFADEPRASDGTPTFAAADVLNVGEAAFDKFTIFVVHGELPHFFSGGFGAGEELVRPGLIGAENANVDIGKRDDNRTCQRSGIDDMRHTELLRIMDSVGKDQAAFRIGV